MATAARNVAGTAISSAFKNGLFPTVGKPETVGNKPFPKHWNQCLLTLNLNCVMFLRRQCFQWFRDFCVLSGTQKALCFLQIIIRQIRKGPSPAQCREKGRGFPIR
nr:MAG TPA: hypothetical protein [Caudoviricetes sp.]